MYRMPCKETSRFKNNKVVGSCVERLEAWKSLNKTDPIPYEGSS